METKNHATAVPTHDEPNIILEEAVNQMRIWLSEIYPASKIDRAMATRKTLEQELISVKIWTYNNEYSIIAHRKFSGVRIYLHENTLNEWCLGASSRSRKPRAGETWQRGNDLADGIFCEETWRRIMIEIVRYEAEEIKSEKWKEPHIMPYLHKDES